MIAHGNFPVRSNYRQGESLAGFVYRLHCENGHLLPRRTFRRIVSIYGDSIWGVDPSVYEEIKALVGHEHIFNPEVWHNAMSQIRALTPAEHLLQRLKADQFAICPACLGAYGMHLGVWELPQVTACPIHSCVLLTYCARCHSRFTWSKLQLDWRCRCGDPLATMLAAPAEDAARALANAICGARDVQRPVGYLIPSRGDMSNATLELATIYRLLKCFHGLRRLVVDVVMPGHHSSSLRAWHASRARRRPHLWECSLVAGWPFGFHRTLVRLAQRVCRSDRSTFVVAGEHSPIQYAFDHLAKMSLCHGAIHPLKSATIDLIANFVAPFRMNILVFYHPRLTNEQRAARVRRLAEWWRALEPLLRTRGDIEIQASIWLTHPVSRESKEALVVRLVNQLVDIAHIGIGVQRCAAAFSMMRTAMCMRPTEGNSDTLIAALATKLMMLPPILLIDLIERAERITLEADP
ncbi:TniQ family protein [Paraburkholderia sp. BR14320]|uniref:TniQ family protein n=1 Tax=unclassified Paraburkholderia TaxID=2615204 RepID=UPI0034CF3190